MISLTILGQFHLLKTNFLEVDKSRTFEFWHMQIGVITLTALETTTILFIFSFFLIRIIKDQKSYYIILFILLLLCVIFGSCLNDYFISQLVSYDSEGNKYVLPFVSKDILYPRWMFIPSILFPFYAPGQTLSIIADQCIIPFGDEALIKPLNWLTKNDFELIDWTINSIENYDYAIDSAWRYDLVLLAPAIQIIFYGSAGILTSKIIKNK